MIKLLTPHSLTVKDRFGAERFALNLAERQSMATITVGPEAPAISVGDWLQDEEDPGKGIVWRVKSVDTDYSTDTRTISCDHLISCLRDLIMFGETTPGAMAGNPNAKTCTAKQAAEYILKNQSDWKLGTMGYTKSAEYNFNGDSLYDALETVTSSLMDAWWSYDFTAYPFKLNIQPQSTAVSCEMRTDRNIRTLKRVIDRTRMFTRFYPIGKNNIKLPTQYLEKNTALYGVVSKVETDQSKDTESKLREWAQEKLNNHAEPLVTVTISGLELSSATGEPLDRLALGTVCRVPLPEYNTTITELITKLNWGDKIADAESVTVTLANAQQDVATIINNITKSGGGGGRADAKNDEEKTAFIIEEKDHVGLLAKAVAGEGADTDWSRVSEIIVDGQGIHQRVTKTQEDMVVAESKIDVLEDKIELKVSKGDIISAINLSPEAIDISSERINLTGYVTASELSVTTAKIDNLMSGATTATSLKTNLLSASTGFTYQGHSVAYYSVDVDGTTRHLLGY